MCSQVETLLTFRGLLENFADIVFDLQRGPHGHGFPVDNYMRVVYVSGGAYSRTNDDNY